VVSSTKPNIVGFGAYEFNIGSKELRKARMRVRLEGQPLAILEVLLDRPGEQSRVRNYRKSCGRGTPLSTSNTA